MFKVSGLLRNFAVMKRKDFELVYGGLAMGLMEAVASATATAGGKVMGVVPETRRCSRCRGFCVTLRL